MTQEQLKLQIASEHVLRSIPKNAREFMDAMPISAVVIMAAVDPEAGSTYIIPASAGYDLPSEVEEKIKAAANEYSDRVNAILMEWSAAERKKKSK